jgi:hypothetical protein
MKGRLTAWDFSYDTHLVQYILHAQPSWETMRKAGIESEIAALQSEAKFS